jgi:hypothetical protein
MNEDPLNKSGGKKERKKQTKEVKQVNRERKKLHTKNSRDLFLPFPKKKRIIKGEKPVDTVSATFNWWILKYIYKKKSKI